MANFALVGSKEILGQATMHTGGKKRVHLVGAGGEAKALAIDSTNGAVVTGRLVALFDGPKGIWTVDLSAAGVGKAEIVAKRAGERIASLAMTVVAPVALPEASSAAGLFVRLFLAEARNPGQSGFNKSESKTAM